MPELTKDQAADVAACRAVIQELRALAALSTSAREQRTALVAIERNRAIIERITGKSEPEWTEDSQ